MSEIIMARDLDERRGSTNPVVSIENTIAFSSRDWGRERDLAWLYGIVFSWDGDPEESDDEGSLPELQTKFGWSDSEATRLQELHRRWKELSDMEETTVSTEQEDLHAVIHETVIRWEYNGGNLETMFRESLAGFSRHPQPETATEAQVEAAARVLFDGEGSDVGDYTWAEMVAEDPSRGDIWRQDARAALKAAAAVTPEEEKQCGAMKN